MEVEIITNGITVWVNDDTGSCIGRYRTGHMDVHYSGAQQIELGLQCLACAHGEMATFKDFQLAMLKHHNVYVPDTMRPRL